MTTFVVPQVGGTMHDDQSFYAHQMVLEKPLREMPPWPAARGRPRGPAAFLSLTEFDATLRQVIVWLDKHYAASPKWRIANAIHQLAAMPRDQRLCLQDALRRENRKRSDEAARKFLRRCETHFHIDLDERITQIRRDLYEA